LMEMPREELEMVDEAGIFDHAHDSWDEHDHGEDDGDTSFSPDEWQLESVTVESSTSDIRPPFGVAATAITTAAALAEEPATATAAEQPPRVSPDVFQQGMTVLHPEYGPGKIVALAGSGKNRRATIQFATVGQKKIILSHSALRPAR
jgi:DNA helicase II / ATP-dependent DNA helicase PcrA